MRKTILWLVTALLAIVTTANAQEYHGEMERIYPEQQTLARRETKKTTATRQDTAEPQQTLVPYLQQLGQELLKGKTGSIVAEDPATGELLCLVTNSPNGPDIDLAIATAYAPGSTFKVAQALALLSEGIVGPKTSVGCRGVLHEGSLKVGCAECVGTLLQHVVSEGLPLTVVEQEIPEQGPSHRPLARLHDQYGTGRTDRGRYSR